MKKTAGLNKPRCFWYFAFVKNVSHFQTKVLIAE